ncbi:MAG: archaellin/type IV pilin N-terminal domain-containing protein [Chloroflexota bacterium]|nr:archaellin/type IV pilin N-terminal domain-containing protein [Chloroflexota bacterium]
MISKLNRMLKDESGITALETAIILIAFVVVASVFAFTILSAGSFSTEQSRDAIYSGLEQVQGSLELRGSVIALTGTTNADYIVFSLGNVAGGDPIDLSTNGPVVVEYRDSNNRITDATYTLGWAYRTDSDNLLEERETAVMTVTVSSASLGVNTTFVIELKPPSGAPLYIERTTPAVLDPVMDLH